MLQYASVTDDEMTSDLDKLELLCVLSHLDPQFLFVDFRTGSGSNLLLPKVAQDLLLNMSVGSSDMSIPNMYHYLPHLVGKPAAIKPAVKLSKGRIGGKY